MLMCPKSKKGRWILERQVAFFICSAKVLVLMMTARSVPTQASTCWRLHWGVLARCLAACRASLCACGRCLHRPGTSQPGSTMWGWGMLCTGARGLTCWRKLGVRVTFHLHLQRADIHYGEKKGCMTAQPSEHNLDNGGSSGIFQSSKVT